MRKICLLCVALVLCSVVAAAEKTVSVKSPDGQVKVNVTLSDRIYYDVESHGEMLLQKSTLGLELGNAFLGQKPALRSTKAESVNETVTPVFPLKCKTVENRYNQLTLTMKGGYAVQWRVYDDGVAYRILTTLRDSVEILSEDATLRLPQECKLVLQQARSFKTSCEEPYSIVVSSEWQRSDKMSELPVVICTPKQKILFSEFSLFSYPGMFLCGNGDNTLCAVHPRQPLAFGDDGDRSVKFLREAHYIARTAGTREYPWRYMFITQDDRQLACNLMPMRLAPKCAIDDVSWIRPGKTTWEWWNGSIPYGEDVNFESGLNLETYKYFADFGAKHGLEYILMDEGWARSTRDPFTPNPDIDLHELIKYTQQKGTGIILWLTWLTVEKNMSLFETFEKWGIKGVKIDFMDRQDQWMVDFYERVAREAAKHHIFVDFHGAYHPSGLEYKYPNVLSFEGVRGMEQMGGCVPDNSVYLPFIRNAVGPMDYTPGAMLSIQPNVYVCRRPNSTSPGTRAYQMALYVLFESHLQMMADNPTLYNMWPDCTAFMAGMPVNWDDTKVLAAEFGEYVVTAKRRGDVWYIGGITNHNKRDVKIDLSFLADGKTYSMTSFSDGINANRQAMDYRRNESKVNKQTVLDIHMARNGGFAAVLK